jgi:HTH-type transcriptional regulator, competence development regulator
MTGRTTDGSTQKRTLGQYLTSIREDRGFTLRQVEEATDKAVSNAYLSQIETGKIQQPSPNVLHALADTYKIDYSQLMEMAGYITQSKPRGADQRHGRLATFAEHNLTPAEESELMEYLKFMRARKKTSDKTRR